MISTTRSLDILVICAVAAVVGATSLAPAEAEACSPLFGHAFGQLPADDEPVPPGARMHIMASGAPGSPGFVPVLTDEQGAEVALDIPTGYAESVGAISDLSTLFVIEPQAPLAPGSYTLEVPSTMEASPTTSTFVVDDTLNNAAPPVVDDFDWDTRVFDAAQPTYNTCGPQEYMQESRVTIPRFDAAAHNHTLIYNVAFKRAGDFDGDVDHVEGDSQTSTYAVVDTPFGDAFDNRGKGRLESNSVVLTTQTVFRVECVEVTVVDLSGERSEAFRRCVPDHCAPAEDAEDTDFADIDWAAQPDCAAIYCADGVDCDGGDQPDAGTGSDAGSDAGEVADSGDSADAGSDADANTPDAAGEPDATTEDATADGDPSNDSSSSSNSDGCATAAGNAATPSFWMAALVIIAAAVRRRKIISRVQ